MFDNVIRSHIIKINELFSDIIKENGNYKFKATLNSKNTIK